jgi:drug/metabolite transporter (DMT)-like permease
MIPDHLTLGVTGIVLCAGLLHAVWNAIASATEDKLVAFGLIGVSYTVVAAVALPLTGMPRSAAIVFVLCSAVLHLAYNFALMQSYRLGDFGRTYPLARGTAPLLVAAGAWGFANEHLDGLQLAGIATVAGGLVAIVFAGGRLTRADVPATMAALLTGAAIASYTVVDGLGVRHADNPLGYTALLFGLQGPVTAVVVAAARRHDLAWATPRNLAAGLTAGVLSLAAYGIVIWAQTQGPLALISALRETSVISAALIASIIFHEPFGRRRVPCALAVVAGIILINL